MWSRANRRGGTNDPADRLVRFHRHARPPAEMTDTLILCYHAVSTSWPALLSVDPEQFERQLEHLLARGYRATTFSEALSGAGAGRTVAITFDDAYRSVFDLGLPILARLGMPATVFVPTAKVGGDGPMAWPGIDEWLQTPHRDELVGCTWDQIGELAQEGWEVGSHTCMHPHLPELDDKALAEELGDSRSELERRLDVPCRSIAYPYGAVDARVVAAAARYGYLTGAALSERVGGRSRSLAMPRVMVRRGESLAAYRRHITRPFRLLERSPLWGPMTRAVPRARAVQRRLRGNG